MKYNRKSNINTHKRECFARKGMKNMKIDYVDHSDSKTMQDATFTVGKCRVSVLNDGLLRVEYGAFVDQCTQAVWHRRAKASKFAFKQDHKRIVVELLDKEVVIDTQSFADSYAIINGKRIPLNNEYNLKGTTRTLDMSPEDFIHYDDPITHERKDIYYTDEKILDDGVCSVSGIAVYDDHSLVIDEDGTIHSNPSEHDYYVFIHPNDYYGAVSDLYDITGKVPLLPRFVFGNWWSRYWAYNDKEYLALLDEFRAKGIPLAVATLDMDWHYVDLQKEFGVLPQGELDEEKYGEWHGWTGWSWNKHLFPDYRAFLNAIKSRDLHITLNLHPASGFRWFEDCYEDVCKRLGVDRESKHVVPFDITDNAFVKAYLDVLHGYEKDGVNFWWIDWQQGTDSKIDGLDPLWGLNHYQYYDAQSSGKRGLILSRYAGVGSHRYPLGFSGDTTQKWSILEYVVNFTASSANIGYTFWSHDIGAHHGGIKDEQLYIRWLQFALFNPIMRLHSASGILYGKEPWNYDKATELLATDILRRRQRLVPYLYSVACANHYENVPFIRPLYYDYPGDKRAYKANCQYMLGDMLVCPITSRTNNRSRLSSRKIYLPSGNWTDIYSGTRYAGNKCYTVYRGLGEIPVFAKDGTIIYRDGELRNDLSHNPTKLQFRLFVGNGNCVVYEDDGESLDCLNGKCLHTIVKQTLDANNLTIEIMFEGDTSAVPSDRTFIIECPNVIIERIESNDAILSEITNYNGVTSFAISGINSDKKIVIYATVSNPEQKTYLGEQVRIVLAGANGCNQYNLDLYDMLMNSEPEKMSELISASSLTPGVKGKLNEILKGLGK